MSFLDVPGIKANEVDAAVTAKIEDEGSDARAALDAAFAPVSGSTSYAAKAVETSKLDVSTAQTTYVKFVDLAGNPISARHVTIKVDTSTWEISDIIAEA
jgi:hypothetical protein